MRCVYLLAILQTITWVQGISKFGAKWHGTFEATALVWQLCYSCDNFQQISLRSATIRYIALAAPLNAPAHGYKD